MTRFDEPWTPAMDRALRMLARGFSKITRGVDGKIKRLGVLEKMHEATLIGLLRDEWVYWRKESDGTQTLVVAERGKNYVRSCGWKDVV